MSMIEPLDNQISTASQTPSAEALQKEIRILKRKLSLAEANLVRAQFIASAHDRVDTILTDSLKKELQFFKLVLENATNILLLFDFDGRFAYASRTFLEEAGIANFGFINGRHFHDVLMPIISPESLLEFSEAVNSAIEQKTTIVLEEQIDFHFKGMPRIFSILVTPMTDADGKSTGIMALFNDITEMNDAMEAAKRANLAKSDFLANMSHEIRTPLNAIIGMSTIAQGSTDIEKIYYCLDKINDSSKHLLGVINDILDMSKIEANHFELSFSEFVFKKMLLRIVDVIGFKIEAKNIVFDLYCDPAMPHSIVSDEQRLAQVIMNLLSNAVKFTPEHGSVALRAEVESTKGSEYVLRISVKDSGIGISEEQKPRLFKAFSQADGSISRKFGGTGLGLAISKTIVGLLEGKIWFDSDSGAGTTFSFTIKTRSPLQNPAVPAAEDDALPNNCVDESSNHAEASDDDFSEKTILLADDIEINREIVISLLEYTGIHIACAENGKEAVEKFIAEPEAYDLIFMDVQMPEMDGYEATRRIRASEEKAARKIPIVAMTANVFKEDIERCMESGMNDHIGKPINLDEILLKIRRWTSG